LLVAEQDDQAAFGELFQLFYPRLLMLAQAILKDRQTAEEAVQDVFMQLWKNRKVLPAINNLQYYLLVAGKHAALDHLEKMERRSYMPLEDAGIEFGKIEVTPEHVLISAETMQAIQVSIDELPPRCKLIFRLVKEDGLKYREVADLLQVSVKTVETQMSLALSKVYVALQSRLPSDAKDQAPGRKKRS
jgi:RNA polymerase sigma-70 factor (ECF subfamily)